MQKQLSFYCCEIGGRISHWCGLLTFSECKEWKGRKSKYVNLKIRWSKLWHRELPCNISHLINTKREKGRNWQMKNLASDKKSPVFGEKEERSSVVIQRMRFSKLISKKVIFLQQQKGMERVNLSPCLPKSGTTMSWWRCGIWRIEEMKCVIWNGHILGKEKALHSTSAQG